MNKYKAKYRYWHIITAVSKGYQKNNPEIKVGLIITNSYPKHDEGVSLFNFKTGKEYPSAYVLGYLGRLPIDSTKDIIFKETKKWIKEKGYQKYLDKLKKKEVTKE